MQCCRLGRTLLVGALLLVPGLAGAQSTIAGVVRDTSGAVLPGVSVEASSPALIEKTRDAVTDGQGRYTLPELRPGIYIVTFTLQGFSTVRRENIQVEASTNVPINAEMQVGAVAETITVSGTTPLVDVQEAAQRQVLNREVLDQLPTNRTTATVGAVVPGLRMTAPMVGGMNSTIVQQYVRTRGKDGRENTTQVEGLDVGWIRGTQDRAYDNFAMAQEVAVETNAAGADVVGRRRPHQPGAPGRRQHVRGRRLLQRQHAGLAVEQHHGRAPGGWPSDPGHFQVHVRREPRGRGLHRPQQAVVLRVGTAESRRPGAGRRSVLRARAREHRRSARHRGGGQRDLHR